VTASPASKERKPMMIPIYEGEVPSLTTEQMIEVDRAMIQEMRIELIQMMENAGRNLAHLARVRFFDGNPAGKHVVVLAGTGGNGGGALVCARRLHTWGALVQVVVTHSSTSFTSYRTAHRMLFPSLPALQQRKSPLVSDRAAVCPGSDYTWPQQMARNRSRAAGGAGRK
jgi:YjeF-related protein N-terminus